MRMGNSEMGLSSGWEVLEWRGILVCPPEMFSPKAELVVVKSLIRLGERHGVVSLLTDSPVVVISAPMLVFLHSQRLMCPMDLL